MRSLVLLAFVLDALTTLVALREGGAEANPLVQDLGPGGYLAAVALRAAIALGLLALARAPRARRLVVGGLAGVVAVKLVASASNLALVAAGAALVTPAHAPALAALGLGVGAVSSALVHPGPKDHDPRPRPRARIS